MSNESADDIIDDVRAAQDKIDALDDQLQDQIEEIKLGAARQKRQTSDAEAAQIEAIEADIAKLADARQALDIDALIRLDRSGDVAAIKQTLTAANDGLAGTLDRLKRIARFAAIAAQVADGLAQLAAKAAALAG